ncbi:acyl carrier protein [Streptomyces sp. NPDC054884]|uniref:acyl carrier protein n=1 Tax=unclassified Streptomyces TaxID=2593676 RepID=UPI0029B7F033|nr:acyl carrier protein [Streptomyces sp. ME08-AFT2]MDX3310851.1 acyl carrier protein [Streptomyces sp. ME08-AFT2]
MIADYLATILGTVYKVPGVIEPTMSFQDLEIDSLSLAELGAQLEDDLGVTVEEENLAPTTTVAELVELLEAQGAVVPA